MRGAGRAVHNIGSNIVASLLLLACNADLSTSLEHHECTRNGECLRGWVCSEDQECVRANQGSSQQPDTEDAGGLGRDGGPTTIPGITSGGPMCNASTLACAGNCVDVNTDTSHCGGCGNECTTGVHGLALCDSGKCAFSCSEGFTRCGDGCYDLSSDAEHCGSCNVSCPQTQNGAYACMAGKCVEACNPSFSQCDGNCFNLQTDASHCGACATSCAADERCAGGKCVKQCPEGSTECSHSCVDLKSDLVNCGACGNTCPQPQGGLPTCSDGTCGAQCPDGLIACNGVCVNAQTDLMNCGACGNVCMASDARSHAKCVAGGCGSACNDGYVACESQCISLFLLQNRELTASCVALGAAQDLLMCQGMGQNSSYCDGKCVSTSSDPLHCGSCDRQCKDGQRCTAGFCF